MNYKLVIYTHLTLLSSPLALVLDVDSVTVTSTWLSPCFMTVNSTKPELSETEYLAPSNDSVTASKTKKGIV